MSSPDHDHHFIELVEEASAAVIEGWHFSFLEGRVATTRLPWDYEGVASGLVQEAERVLDVDTGGGEVLARLHPGRGSLAVEDWPTNLPIARRRLEPLGVSVRSRVDGALPADDSSVDLVLNRHGDLDLAETARVLRPGGTLFSQQVALGNEAEINDAFGVQPTESPNAVRNVPDLLARVEAAGLVPDVAAEAVTVTRYLDVGALVLQLRAVPWQVPDFDADRHLPVLRRAHRHIQRFGSFDVRSRRLLLQARRPR